MKDAAARLPGGGRSRLTLVAGAVLVAAVVVLAVADGLLIAQNRSMKSSLASARASLLPPIGRNVPPLRGLSLAGLPTVIGYGQGVKTTLVFTFGAGCPFCSATWPVWHSLVMRVDPQKARVVFVNLGMPLNRNFVTSHNLEFATVIDRVGAASAVAYNFIEAPELIEISSSGIVEAAWVGTPKPAIIARLLATVGGTGTRRFAPNN